MFNNQLLLKPQNRIYVPKGWGGEDWIWNDEKYCGKKLYFHKNKKCSFHFHQIKDEVLFIEHGKIRLLYGYDKNIDLANNITLNVNDGFHILPNLIHQMIAIEESVIFEFSTHHKDCDSIVVIKGD